MRAGCQERTDPFKYLTRNTEGRREPLQQDVMVHRIEGGTDIKKSQKHDAAAIDSREDVREHTKDCRLGGMTATKSRLEFRKQVIAGQVSNQLPSHDLLDYLGQNCEPQDWGKVLI